VRFFDEIHDLTYARVNVFQRSYGSDLNFSIGVYKPGE
jgi:hypothetical protein